MESTYLGPQLAELFENPESAEVLSTTIKFICGISLPDDLSVEDAKNLLTLADLYLMEDLKEAVAHVLGAQLDKDNILEISKMAEKCTASKLMEICVDFIVSWNRPDHQLQKAEGF